jgi:hypothetical protein
MTRTTKTSEKQANAPALIAYFVPERENAPWTRIGALWAHKDGKGYNLDLELVPAPNAQGRVVLRNYEPKEAKPDGETQDKGEGA